MRWRSSFITITRVSAPGPDSERTFTPYRYAIRPGGGVVRRVWLDRIRRRADQLEDYLGHSSMDMRYTPYASIQKTDG